MRLIGTIIIVCLVSLSYAQKYDVQGQLADTLGAPLPAATVLLLAVNDSSLVNFTLTDIEGNFRFKNIAAKEYFLKVSFVGFKTVMQKVNPPATGTMLSLGKVQMLPATNELDAIEIAAERAPVTIKKDTIEFNAGSFKTQQNAMVEDLLKKLPGVEVDNNGNITAQGERVKRVTVDGKNFFGADPKIATKNLPADAIDKVQVFDKKSDQTEFTGIDDGQREKTINLELKEEKRHGAFGSLMAGAGTEDRFQSRASVNKFSKTQQLSLLGMGNNVNESGFSMDEYMNFTGGSQQMMSGGAVRLEFGGDNQNGVPLNFGDRANGIMTTYAAGINFNNELSKKSEVNGSYFFNYLDHNREQQTQRENFLPNGNYTFNQNSRQNNYNTNHRVNGTFDQKIDSSNSIKFTTNLSLNSTETNLDSESESRDSENALQNESAARSYASGQNNAMTSSILWRHKFNKRGRTLTTNFQHGISQNDRDGFMESTNQFYRDGETITQNLEQQSIQQTDYNSYAGAVSFTEPLGKRKYLEANYSYRANLNNVDRKVYDVNNEESVLNTQLTNAYNSNYQYHKAGINFRMVKPKFNLVAGTSFQNTNLTGTIKTSDTDIDRSFENILPSLRFNYDFSTTKHLRLEYDTDVEEPSIQQLQPVIDNSDPLNIYQGNPSLRPAYAQNWRLNFMTFDPATFVSFFTFVDLTQTANAIVNSQSINEDLVRTTKPVNGSSSTRMNAQANFGFPVNKLNSRFNFGANYRTQRTFTELNEVENRLDQNAMRGTARYSFTYKEILDISASAEIEKQNTSYQFNQPDQQFENQIYSAESNLNFLKNYQLSGSFEYLIYNNKSTSFRQAIPMLDLSLSRYILKNKTGEIKFAVNNLLDKALGVNQTATINYLERQVTNSLGRYFMVSFTYALNKQLNPMGMRRGGHNIRIMR